MHPLILKALEEGRPLLESEAKDVLQSYDIQVLPYRLATSEDEAVAYAKEMGYPVAMKIVSPDILHKSDAHGVILKIHNAAEARSAYCKIVENAKAYRADARVAGVLVSPMAKRGVEIIIGMNRDPQFGPVIMFGLGGIFVEVFKDVSFRITPVSKREARKMIEEIKAFPILKGVRGENPKDIDALVNLIEVISRLSDEHPDLKELDLNPVFVYDDGISVVDARMIV
jgi:acetyl-CoA synthetase (ADP-forming)